MDIKVDKNKILNAASVLFQNIFTYFNQLEESESKETSCKLKDRKEEAKHDKD